MYVFIKNINMTRTLFNSVILHLVCGSCGKECTSILHAKRRRQSPEIAVRDRLYLLQKQKYIRLLHNKVSILRCFAREM